MAARDNSHNSENPATIETSFVSSSVDSPAPGSRQCNKSGIVSKPACHNTALQNSSQRCLFTSNPLTSNGPAGESGPALTAQKFGASDEQAGMPRRVRPERPEPIFVEPCKTSLNEALIPIARKQSVKAIAKYQREAPMLVRLDVIRAAKVNSGLSNREIGELIGEPGKPVSEPTIAAALRFDPSVSNGTLFAVLNVLGIEPAELFPIRKRRVAKQIQFERGPYDNYEQTARAANDRRRRRWRRD